ncbi:Fujikurins efflux protein [Lachnellula cervina]|uniref:Fujikurins efflux protein n=1 Tax=Lachnellula cervina TaxID=1316786 RepID=A0A7D8UWQ3_9HELO|nr:Fujikurins efflux protein [Lachnellula cervina]
MEYENTPAESDPKRPSVSEINEVFAQDLDAQKFSDDLVFDFPEGGRRAWMAVAGAFLCLFVGGVEYGFGVFITYYSTHFLKDEPVSTIAWIGSAGAFIHTTVGLLVGKLYDDGWFRHLIFFGSFLHVFSFMMLSLCTKFWQVWLAQGLGMGVATGFLYQPGWLSRRRSFAMGIVMTGASTGGVLFPILMNNSIDKLGFAWGIRVTAFLMLGVLIIANVIIAPRISTRSIGGKARIKKDTISGRETPIHKVNYRQFFDPAFIVTTAGCFLIQIGTGFPYAYITSYATLEGNISANLQFYLLPLTFAGSAVGSPIMAALGDSVGVFNIVISSTFISAGLQASIYGAKTDASAVLISFVYGFMAAGFQSMVGPIYARLSSTVLEIGHRMGIGFFIIGIGTLISSPIQGALLGSNAATYEWWKPLMFSVLCLLLGSCLLAVSRHMLIKRFGILQTIAGFIRV